MDTVERFLTKVNKVDGGCWEWNVYILPSGYGQFYLDGKLGYAHRASYTLFVGPIPEGLQIDHLCRNRACVNPKHLEAVTMRENLRRGEGATGLKARQTECIHGHEFTPENTYIKKNGCRSCRACAAAYQRRLRKTRASAAPRP